MKSNATVFGISEENFEISMIGILFVFVIMFSCILEFCYFLRDCYYSNPTERDSLAEIETMPMHETQSDLLRHLSNETQSLEFLQVINLKNNKYNKKIILKQFFYYFRFYNRCYTYFQASLKNEGSILILQDITYAQEIYLEGRHHIIYLPRNQLQRHLITLDGIPKIEAIYLLLLVEKWFKRTIQ